ncbi:MAG TPA: hypothetical protein VHE61_18405 [Opitutaceae bacterium]|nr:hypothetical protein [Opitutaceae bacterium]
MRFVPVRSGSLLALRLLAGGAGGRAPLTEVRGVIQSVDDVSGRHYFVAVGEEPVMGITVRRTDATSPSATLRILVPGLYAPEQYGRPGDAVRFQLRSATGDADRVWIQQVQVCRRTPAGSGRP